MVFSDTTNKLGVIQTCERYTGKGDAGISGDAQLLKEFTAHSNEILRRIWHIIFTASGTWQYDDSNYTDLPQATDTLVSGTDKYALPTETLAIERLEVKDTSGVWKQLKPRDLHSIPAGEGEYFNDDGIPHYYRLLGNTIQLYPAPNYNSSGGLKVFFQRGSVSFESTDTTQTPGFASEYHGAVPKGASLEWFMSNVPTSPVIPRLEKAYQTDLANIKEFYQNRNRHTKPKIARRYQSYK